MTGYIYSLSNTEKGIFYIGSTVSPKNRLRSHKTKFGYSIKMEILVTAIVSNIDELFSLEAFWNKEFKQRGFVLLNKDIPKVYRNAPQNVVDYVLNIYYSDPDNTKQITNKKFDSIMWDIITEHRLNFLMNKLDN